MLKTPLTTKEVYKPGTTVDFFDTVYDANGQEVCIYDLAKAHDALVVRIKQLEEEAKDYRGEIAQMKETCSCWK